ncbi:hypothetical protein T01_9985 [Trichinella spiralis]|uniref:Uncharacterized protein n=1 Tax=Trichinella spiralis TaxID=6334 RepID=A0A0V1BLZ5_TRISP|nr:hypothetical protein T01_9985 [Trichinella spiralis]
MKRLEIVATHSDLFKAMVRNSWGRAPLVENHCLKVIVNITAPLEEPTKPLQYFFPKIPSCRCVKIMKIPTAVDVQ